MAKFNKQPPKIEARNEMTSDFRNEAAVETIRTEVATVKAPAAPPASVENETDFLMASQASQHALDPAFTMQMPTSDDDSMKDKPHSKDELFSNHANRVGNKRLFMTDMLSRVLGCDTYLLSVDKLWVPNPLGKGGNIAVRFTREFPTKYILFDKFDVQPDPELVTYKRGLAHKHGYKYIYETPQDVLSHQRLNELLDQQKDVKNPDEGK